MRKLFTIGSELLALALGACDAAAQTSLTADRIYLGATGCALRTGSGTPTGGTACDFYLDTATGHVWMNVGGTWVNVSTTVSVARGGTGVTSLTAGGVVYGNGTNPVGVTAAPATNSVLASAAGVPLFTTGPTVVSLTATSTVTTPQVGATANLQLQPTGDLVLAPAGRDVLPGVNYTTNLGALEDKYLTLHAAELWVETLVAQQTMATIGGRVLVAPTNILAADLPAAATTITVKYNNFQNGDRVYLEANARLEFMAITSAASGSAGAYTYTVTRNLDGSGADAWSAGDALLNTGTTGNGFIDLYSVSGVLSGAGPTIVGNVRTGTTFNQIEPRWAIGNLNGLYGYSGSTYGAAFGTPTGAWLKIDPTNGVRIGYNTTTNTQIDAAGNATFSGTVNAAAGAIGGWSIGADYLRDTGNSTGMASTVTGANDVRFWAGATFANRGAAPFRVYEDGSAVMTSVVVSAPNAGRGGAALNMDPDTGDIAAWSPCAGVCTIASIGDGKVGATSLRSNTGLQAQPIEIRRVPFDANKTYRFHVWARAGGGANGTFYAGLSAFDASGVECDYLGCPSTVSRYAYCASAVAAATIATWTEYICTYGAGSATAVPANIRSVAVQVILNYLGTAGWMEVQDIRLEEMAPSTLIKDNAITTGKITAGAITATKIASGSGTNLIPNSECRTSTDGWTSTPGNTGSASITFSYGHPSFSLLGGSSTCYFQPSGTPAALSQALAYSGPSPALAGKVYEASAYLGTQHNGSATVALEFLNASGTAITQVPGTSCTNAGGGAGQTLAEYCRSYVIATAPAATVSVRMWILATYGGGQTVPATFFVRAMVAEGKINQTEPSEWTPAGLSEITGGIIRTGAITANHIAAGAITADKIAAGAITAGALAADSVTSANIVAGTITSADIAASTITGGNIAGSTITSGNVADGTLTGSDIASTTITGGNIATGTITAGNIAAGTITAGRLNVTSLSAISANLGSVTAGSISSVNITGGTIDGTTIRGVTISASSTLSGGSITGTSISSSTMTAGAVTLDGNGITVAAGEGGGSARIKLGSVQLWGTSGGYLTSDQAFDIQAIRAHGVVDFERSAHIYQTAQIDGILTTGAAITNGGNHNFQNNSTSLYWLNGGSPPTGTAAMMGWNSGCACLVYNVSSVRFKENIRPWTTPDALAILALPLVRFDLKHEPGIIPSNDHVGFLVEDLVKLAPDAVAYDAQRRPESFYSDTLDAYLLAALKAVNARVTRTEELEARILELERQVAALLARKGGTP